MSQKEKNIINKRLLALDGKTQRRFRINAGRGWMSNDVTWQTVGKNKLLTLKNPRILNAAPEGWPDLCGWDTVEITQDMVGQKIAVFVGEEVKTGRLKLSKVQKMFGDVLSKMGGMFRVIREKDGEVTETLR